MIATINHATAGKALAAPDFLYRDVPAFKKRVHRLGLAGNFGIDEAGIAAALERGVNYFFWPLRQANLGNVLREAARRDRERLVIASVATIGYFGTTVRSGAEKALRLLGTDYLDVFMLGWLGKASLWTRGTVDALCKLREEGKVRAIGVSIHDRKRAGELARDSPLDLLMVRYNAAHPGAEREVFPERAVRNTALVAYTATSWGQLLRRPSGWEEPVPSAGDCYRFCLSNDAVDVVLSGPASLAQLDENLEALKKGPLSTDEMAWMRRFGALVHKRSLMPGAPR